MRWASKMLSTSTASLSTRTVIGLRRHDVGELGAADVDVLLVAAGEIAVGVDAGEAALLVGRRRRRRRAFWR